MRPLGSLDDVKPLSAHTIKAPNIMPYTRDFDLVIPGQAILLRPDEILPGLRDYLSAVGISDPNRYHHYQVRILVRPRTPGGGAQNTIAALFSARDVLSRKGKRRAFSTVDSVFVTLAQGHSDILFREVYPPPTTRDGQPELSLGADITVGAGVAATNAKAAAEIHAKFKKEFRFKEFTVVSQKTEGTAVWDFRRSWFEDGRQPEVCLTLSVPETLSAEHRFVKCQRRVTSDGRSIISPNKAKRINLPTPI